MKLITTLLAGLAVAVMAGPAPAQTDFPNKPVTILVPFAAGGASDIATRTLADGLSKKWGQPVVVENRPGGGTIIATSAVAQSAKDGYTLGTFTPTFVINPAVRDNLPYDSLKDFVGVSMIVESPSAIVATKSFPAKNLEELIAEAKSRPADRPVTFASVGEGSFGHLAGLRLQSLSGISMQHIPYAGSTQALPDLVAGRVDLFFGAWTDVRAQVENGDMRLIAPYTDVPLGGGIKDVPPALSTVYPEFQARAFTGILGPSGIPQEVLEKINADAREVLSSPEVAKVAAGFNASPWPATLAETQDFINKSIADWTAVAKAENIKLK